MSMSIRRTPATRPRCDVTTDRSAKTATAIAQYGELFQGAIRDGDGRLRRCLVSLPCAALHSTAVFHPVRGDALAVVPARKRKALRAAALALEFLEEPVGGVVAVASSIPEAKGCGSSTADCVASVLAVAAALERRFEPTEVADLVVRAETASGNTMFDTPVLFAHREGRIVERYERPIPALAALGFDTDLARTVDTLKFPPAVYSAEQVRRFEVLAAALRRAIHSQDLRLLGQVSTACAQVNESFLPKPWFRDLRIIAETVGAVGLAVAHSGTVAAVLLDPADPWCNAKMNQLERRLAALGARQFTRFFTSQRIDSHVDPVPDRRSAAGDRSSVARHAR